MLFYFVSIALGSLHTMKLKTLLLVVAILCVSLFVVACGDDVETTAGGEGEATTTEATTTVATTTKATTTKKTTTATTTAAATGIPSELTSLLPTKLPDNTTPDILHRISFDTEDDYHRPHSYPENAVAYSGTHDNNTLLGYLWELETDKKCLMLDYIGVEPDRWQEAVRPIVKTILRSRAAITLFPIQDILGYGSDTRMNTPGRAKGNWAYRVTEEQLRGIDRRALFRLNQIYGRVKR